MKSVARGDIVQVQGDVFQRVADGVAAVLNGDVVDRQLRILGGDRDLHAVAAGTGVIALAL